MLRRAIALVVMIAASFVGVLSTAPTASGDCAANPETGEVDCEVGDGGDPGGDPGDRGGTDPAGSSMCDAGGREIPCSGPAGSEWNGTCYVGGPAPQQPPHGPNGATIPADGEYHVCYFPPGLVPNTYCYGTPCVWVRAGETLIDPVVLAHRAVAAMDLDPITIGIVPESGPNRVGLVGLPVWMWVHNATADTFGPITASASEGPVSVRATANVSNIIWNMDDGTTVTCTGRGTPYADRYGKQDSPTCGHRYTKTSTDRPDRAYQVTATSHWVVEWTGGGQSGTIEFDLTTDQLPIRIGEAQVLTQ